MKNFFKKLNNKINSTAIKAKTAIENKTAEMYVDKGVGIIIAVVVGAAILAGVYALFKTTILPSMTTKVGEMWNYAG